MNTIKYKDFQFEKDEIDEILDFIHKNSPQEQFEFFNFLANNHRDIDIEWISLFEDIKDNLKYNDNISESEKFIKWYSNFEPDKYAKKYEFIERDLCDFYFHTNDLPKLTERVNYIQKHPVSGIETLTIRLYHQLLHNGFYAEALNYAKSTYKIIEDSDEIWGNPENVLMQGIYLDALQQTYQLYKETGKFNLNTLLKLAEEFDLEENEKILKIEQNALQNPLNGKDLLKKYYNNQISYPDLLAELNVHFIKYMYDQFNFPFNLSENFWNIISVKKLLGQSKKYDFFYIDVKKFSDILDKRVDYNLGSNDLEMFGKIFSLHYIYDFLEKHSLISPKAAELMKVNNIYHRNEMIKYMGNQLWQMNFIFDWPENHLWADLKPLFSSTFDISHNDAVKLLSDFFKSQAVPQR